MRITNLHLIVSFLLLSGAGFFAYQLFGRQSLPPLPPIQASKPLTDDSALRLQDARKKAERSLLNASGVMDVARQQRRPVSGAQETYDEARRRFAAAGTEDDYLDVTALAEQAIQQAREGAEARQAEVPHVGTYVVRRGDNLWNISKRPEVYGRGAGWVKIWRANEKKVPDFDILVSGTELKIPR